MKDMMMKPKIWLIIIALMHLFMVVIGGYVMNGGTIDDVSIMIYLGITSIYLLYTAFMTEGQTQARFAVILCAPIVAWFVIGFILKLDFLGVPVAEMPSALMPLTLWTLPVITGVINWNTD